MQYNFFAFISRMRNIGRWSLMRNFSAENVQEHSHMVAVFAHALAVIRRDVLGGDADPERAAAAALFHDASEIFTGDMPTPVKYFNPDIMCAYKEVERIADRKLLATLPPEMRDAYAEAFSPPEETESLVRAADRLAAYVKCLEELRAGNREFLLAARQTEEKLRALGLPEVDYFMERFILPFEWTLDELNYTLRDGDE